MTKTIQISDFELSKLNDGYSVQIGDTLITFAEGSKRYIKVNEQ